MWLWVAATTVGFVIAVKVVYNLRSGRCRSQVKLVGKTVIVTGASAGIGKETARDLAERGARVILACRNLEKAQKVADDIINSTGNGQVLVRQLDTSDLKSVRKFAKEILATEKHLDILVNNAGMSGPTTKKITSDGLELTMATNHFGHFLLTNMLLGLLKSSAPSRIINVSSAAHYFCKELNLDFNFEKKPYAGSLFVYSQSKLANNLFTLELSEKLKGSGVTTNCLHPGVVNTEITLKENKGILNYIFSFFFWSMGKDETLGAQTTIHLAVSEEVANESGKYFTDCKIIKPSDIANDKGLAKKLWEISEDLVGLSQEEKNY
ncbi:retinol dehydrogenase 11-like [Penaeus japonicus]|uniref:retinol dehydrogenase 11-like n=1 Tax=Penaeus japonicus TaxID=27405 RepID=UPI001C717787|nr:retinol dehydrogenase 11-like [Penaeus japonicus]